VYNNFKGRRRVYKLDDFYRKEWEIKDIFSGGSFFDVTSLVSDLNYLNPFLSNKWNSIR